MKNLFKITTYILTIGILLIACGIPKISSKSVQYDWLKPWDSINSDSNSSALQSWKTLYTDSLLSLMIDTALRRNQELNQAFQEMVIAQNEARAKKAEYLPFVNIETNSAIEKPGTFSKDGAIEKNIPIKENLAFPDPFSNHQIGFAARWEVDIWKKMRNARKAAIKKYLASIQGKNFLTTNLIAEIASAYYELIALDNQLLTLNQNIQIQQQALEIVKLQKEATTVTELAVKKFEAEVLKNQGRIYVIKQNITVVENKIRWMLGGWNGSIPRKSSSILTIVLDTLTTGLPSQLLMNRPDVQQAELSMQAAGLNIQVARAQFYPSLGINACLGLNSFQPKLLISPESIMFNTAGNLIAPLINKNALKASYNAANATQIKSAYQYEQTLLLAYLEVGNQLANIKNLQSQFVLKSKEVDALVSSINISTELFNAARADYMEVLMTQRDALDAKMELIETRKNQFLAQIQLYKALGGGWR